MIKKQLVPNGWPCNLGEAPEGMFITLDNPDLICFKTEYLNKDGSVKAFNSEGEYFCGKGDNEIVQPVMVIDQGAN